MEKKIIKAYQTEKIQEQNGIVSCSHGDSKLDIQNSKKETFAEDSEEDIDAMIEELENEDSDDIFTQQYRESKMQAFYDSLKKIEQNVTSGKYGKVNEIHNENELMHAVLNNKTGKTCIMFFQPNFLKCMELEQHMQNVASQLYNTVFYKINVADCPFLVSKFKLKVLPFCVCYSSQLDGSKILSTLVGFPQFDGAEDFTTEEALIKCLLLD
ncbi:hypothetical protein ACO0RG_002621 [Hanseniaspora osmophila]|uniref:Phosducin-like protein 1 n=1 Tax=Hanseniaspora osmophila TaxID=56408 RepID=A0A1E5R7I6_9ASCO|nr:Phosducin-like protein 1 [Hanseniaspora osmophila]